MMSLRHKGLNSALPLKRQARKRVGVGGVGRVSWEEVVSTPVERKVQAFAPKSNDKSRVY